MESLLKRIERNRREHDRLIALILCLSLIVSMGTFAVFHKKAVAKTYIRQVLDCPLAAEGAGLVVHTHNDDCFDENHNLVCTLPELEAHTHTDACYTEVPVQVCGLAESVGHVHGSDCRTLMLTCEEEELEATLDEEGNLADAGHVHTPDCYSEVLSCGMKEGDGAHTHTDACYETEYVLACDKPEVLLHVHTDDCYQKNEDGSIYVDENGYSWLICGLPEVVQHVHGPECFTAYELDDGEPEEAEEDEETTDTTDTTDTEDMTVPALPMPAQSWERTAGGIKVSVEAPEGAFPENTRIAVTPVNGSSLMDTVSDAVNGEVLEVQAVDITFFDAEGHEIEPVIPIRVVMTPAATEHAEEKTNVVHVDITQQTAELIEQAAGTEFDNSEVVFDAEAFTIYAIVYTVDFEYGVNGKLFTSSMPGAEDMPLSEIVNGLGIVGEEELESFLSKITSVTSTNEEVAVVTEDRSVRVLKDGDAQIVITMQDGAAFSISVEAEGVTEISDENEVATVSTVNDLYLPAAGEVKAELLTEEQSETVISAVQTATEIDESSAATYHAFSIALENVDVTAYDGFDVAVTLPEDAVVGRDFQLYQVREDGTATDLTESLTVTSVPNDNGLQNVSGIRFKTEDFADFVLSYSIETYYTTADGDTYRITLNYGPKAGIPEGAELQVEEILPEDESYTDYLNESAAKLGVDSGDVSFARFFDIEIQKDGEKIEPKAPVQVTISLTDAPEEAVPEDLRILHFAPAGLETIDETKAEQKEDATIALSFEANGFSVYGVVYTVDFHWKVNGKTYDFSIPGGGFVSLEHIVEALCLETNADDPHEAKEAELAEESAGAEISDDGAEVYGEAISLNEIEVSDAAREFVADVEKVEFSSHELVWVGKVNEASTVGGLKEANELEIEYSANLTEEQIAEINAQTVEAGDWVLISIKPFDTEETLTVSMKNGEVFTIWVTDAQISTNVLTADGKTYRITVTYDDDAEIPAGTKLTAEEIEIGTDEYLQHLGRAWLEVNKEFFEVEEMRKNYSENMGFLPEVNLQNLDSARFFDLKLIYHGEEIEPSAPVHVEIELVEGLKVEDNSSAGIAHFSKNGLEIIDEVETKTEESKAVYFSYEQESFSQTGMFISHETYDLGMSSAATLTNSFQDPPTLTRGGEETGESDDESDQLEKPHASKTLEPNKTQGGTGDGTYTLTLSVSGTSKKSSFSEVTKSNVLIVMDRSSSMETNKTYVEYKGAYDSQLEYYGWVNNSYEALNYNSYNGQYTYTYRDNYFPYTTHTVNYTGTVYVRKTRLAAEQDALASLITQLTDKNMPGQTVTDEDGNAISLDDIIEVKLISFASGRTDHDKANGFKRNGNTVDTRGTTFDNTESGWGTDYSDDSTLKNAVTDKSVAKGTNWEEAMEYAKEIADAKKAAQPDETVYVIFLTDGEPTDINGDNGNAQYYQNNERCLTAAEPDAKAIVDPHTVTASDGESVTTDHKFYGIFTYGDTDAMKNYLRRLVNYAYGKGDVGTEEISGGTADYYFDADSTSALLNAFQNIMSQVSDSVAYGKVSITDGLTTDAMTTTLVHGKAEGYQYTVTGKLGELYSVTAASPTEGQTDPTVTFTINGNHYPGTKKTAVIDGTSYEYWSYTAGEGPNAVEYKITLADVSTDGTLRWDLTGIGTLMDGYTYSASFVVWPDQDAYDYVAALNNGLPGYTWNTGASTYEDLTSTKGYAKGGVEAFPSIVRYPDGTYAVLTNTDQKVQYSIVETKEEDGETSTTYNGPYQIELPTPSPMPLTASASQIEKLWDVERDPGILAQLLYDLEGNSKNYKIEFEILKDDEQKKYTTVTMGWDETANGGTGAYAWDPGIVQTVIYNGHPCVVGTRWASDFSIATGLMLSETQMNARKLDKTAYPSGEYNGVRYYVLEEGHDYTIKEPGLTYEFDFSSPIYHPMLVDGVLKNVNFTRNGNNVAFTSMTAGETGLSRLKIKNTLRGYINLKKVVLDEQGTHVTDDNTKFTYTIELHNSTNPGPFIEDGSHIPWYGISSLFYHTEDEDGYHYYQARATTTGLSLTDESGATYTATCEGNFDQDAVGPTAVTFSDGPKEGTTILLYGNQMDCENANKVTAQVQITRAQTLNIANVPVGTTYTITESEQSGYQLVKIEREIKINEEAQSAESKDTVSGNATITGTIQANRDNQITYFNKTLVTE